MVSLVDLAPSVETATIGGKTISVPGVSAEGLAHLIHKFPELGQLMRGDSSAVTMDRVVKVAPKALAAILAAGCGEPGDEAAEVAAARLPVSAQAELFEAVLRATLPNGLGPFVQRLTAMAGQLGLEDGSKAQASSSEKPSKS